MAQPALRGGIEEELESREAGQQQDAQEPRAQQANMPRRCLGRARTQMVISMPS
jgi:hypothetical protein